MKYYRFFMLVATLSLSFNWDRSFADDVPSTPAKTTPDKTPDKPTDNGADQAAEKPAEQKTYPRPPWHLIDTWWNIGEDVPFESYSIDVTISEDVPNSVRMYISPIGLGKLNKQQFYGGLQTRSDGYTKQITKLREIGRGLLFSMWGERNHEAIRPADGGFCQSSGHEGDFVSVRRPYEWKKGKYTYRIAKMDREEVEGKPSTWVGAFVYSHEKDENIFVGALRFQGENLVLGKQLANFIEIYGGPIPVSEIPKLTITFGNLTVNGKPVLKPTAYANYPKNIPDYAEAKGEAGQIVVKVGEPVENRTQRKVDLLKN